MGHEIYRIKIEEADFQSHLTFKQICEIAHQCYSAIVFALEISTKGVDGEIRSVIRLNPNQFELVDWHIFNFYLFLICEDESVAKQLSKLEMPDDKYERIMGKPRLQP